MKSARSFINIKAKKEGYSLFFKVNSEALALCDSNEQNPVSVPAQSMSQIFNIEYYSSPTTRHETTRMLFYHNQLFRVISTIGLPTKSSHGYKSEKILWKIRIVDSNKRLHGKESNVFRRQKDRPQVLLINYTSSSEHMLRFSALKPTVGLGCRGGARTSTIVH